MRIRPPRTLAAACLTFLLATLAQGALASEPPLRLNFGVYSSNKPSAMVRVFKPALQELERLMGQRLGREVDIRMQIARDYERGITDLTEGRVDFSRFGPASYVEAKKLNPDISILAMENENNSRVFYGIIAVGADSDIDQISDLEGRSFAFGDEGSTIGRFLSQLYLEQHGIRAGNLSRYEYLGRHDKVGTAVAAGDFAAGALNEATFKKLVDAGEPLRELVRFPNVTKPWLARSGLDAEVSDALQASLLEIENAEALAGLKIDGFLSGSDADYNDIRNSIEDNAAFFSDPDEELSEKRIAVKAAESVEEEPRRGAPEGISAAADIGTGAGRNVGREPVMQAAVADSRVTREGNRLTINIALPSALFGASDGRSTDLTINLTVPEAAAR